MSVLLHISDTHFGTEQKPVVEALKALVRQRRPDGLILSGDVTQRATAAQFESARKLLDELGPLPRLVLPGNHDIPLYNVAMRLWQPYRRYAKAFGTELEPVLDTGDCLVIGVNTSRPMRHTDGEVSASQVDGVVRRLAAARPGQLRIVVTHQPAAVIRAGDVHDRLRGAEPALRAWAKAGADLVLGGHIHLPYVVEANGHGKAEGARPLWCVQAGTTLSHRVRWGTANSLNLIHWEAAAPGQPRSCRVERCDYDEHTAAFVAADDHQLALGD